MTLRALELTLWHLDPRHDPILMAQTFAPDCHEFGCSGRRYTRAELLDPATARPSTLPSVTHPMIQRNSTFPKPVLSCHQPPLPLTRAARKGEPYGH